MHADCEMSLIAAADAGKEAAGAPSHEAMAGALFAACWGSDAACVQLLLAAGADPNFRLVQGEGHWRPVHLATQLGSTACVGVLLEHAATDGLALDSNRRPALHWAGDVQTARLLLKAAPQAALMRDRAGNTPLLAAVAEARCSVAECLLVEAPLQPAEESVDSLKWKLSELDLLTGNPEHLQQRRAMLRVVPLLVARLEPTFDTFYWWLNRRLLTHPHLAVWLPAMLQHSEAAARRLVHYLPLADRSRLRTLALCLGRIERGLSKQLPTPIMHRLLADAAVQHAKEQPGIGPPGSWASAPDDVPLWLHAVPFVLRLIFMLCSYYILRNVFSLFNRNTGS